MASWAASGMSVLPGLSPRPQHHVVKKKDITEEVNSTSPSLFVSVRECENVNIKVSGKVGKISLESSIGVKISIDNRVVGGVFEVIKCQNVTIQIASEGEVPTFQVDDSSNVTVEVCARSQIECIYYIRCNGLKLLLTNQQMEGQDKEAALEYDIPTEEERAQIQQIAHWSAPSADAAFVTENVVRDGVYPTTAQMKKAADEKKQQMINGMASMLLSGIDIKKPEESKKEIGKPIPWNKLGRETDDEKKEYFDDEEKLSQKLDTLAEWIRQSQHCIFFTGAGISTSAGIPDYRSGMNTVLPTGPGAWELRDAGKSRSKKNKMKFLQAIPTYTHLSIAQLQQTGFVKFVVSQNVDGIHLRSGLDPKTLSELHGNTNLEICSKCNKKYLRDFRTRNASKVHDHNTGRICADPNCRGPLKDSIINFGEGLPEKDFNLAYSHAEKADLCIAMGSSLTVSPANEIPEIVSERKQHLVICNLQNTPLHSRCDLPIYAMCDDIMKGLMNRLNIEVDKWKLKRRVRVEMKKQPRDRGLKVRVAGYDLKRELPYSLFQKVIFYYRQSGKSNVEEITKEKEPFEISLETLKKDNKVSCQLHFRGHYAEEVAMINLDTDRNPGFYDLDMEYDLEERKWTYKKRET